MITTELPVIEENGYGSYEFLKRRSGILQSLSAQKLFNDADASSTRASCYVFDEKTKKSFTLDKVRVTVSFSEKWKQRTNEPDRNDLIRYADISYEDFNIGWDIEVCHMGHVSIYLVYGCSPGQPDFWQSSFASQEKMSELVKSGYQFLL